MKSQNNILLFLNIFITIIYLFLAIYGSIFFWNRDYTIARYWVEQKEKHSYAIFMNRTIFSGEGFGGQDFTNILIALALVLYVLSFNSKFNYWFFPLRKYTGFELI